MKWKLYEAATELCGLLKQVVLTRQGKSVNMIFF